MSRHQSRSQSSSGRWKQHGSHTVEDRHSWGHDENGERAHGRTRRSNVDHPRQTSSKRRRLGSDEGKMSRSPSPAEEDRPRSSDSHHHHHHHRHHRRHHHGGRHGGHRSKRQGSKPRAPSPEELPFGARKLSRGDRDAFMPLFAYYLDLQKQLDITALDETEVRGRWKSFLGKWNRGELAEGWYDPEIFERATEYFGHLDRGRSASAQPESVSPPDARSAASSPAPSRNREQGREDCGVNGEVGNDDDVTENDDDDDEYDDYGPPLPPPHPAARARIRTTSSTLTPIPAPGPTIPTQADLSLRDEAAATARAAAQQQQRLARHAAHREQRALLEEALPPRADAGTRERRLEKRREVNERMRAFRERRSASPPERPGGGGGAVGEEGDKDPREEFREMVRRRDEKRRERVSRREEMERARRAEREERVRAYREKEARVVEGLRALARERFGV